jgi:hypothetical protein
MSAILPTAAEERTSREVREGPKGDIRSGHKFAVPRMTSRKCRCLAVGHSDSGAELQVINFEQNWHRLSLYLSGGVGVESATVEACQ